MAFGWKLLHRGFWKGWMAPESTWIMGGLVFGKVRPFGKSEQGRDCDTHSNKW